MSKNYCVIVEVRVESHEDKKRLNIENTVHQRRRLFVSNFFDEPETEENVNRVCEMLGLHPTDLTIELPENSVESAPIDTNPDGTPIVLSTGDDQQSRGESLSDMELKVTTPQ